MEGGKKSNKNRQDFVNSIKNKIKDGSDESERMIDIMKKGGLIGTTDVNGLVDKHFSDTKTARGRKTKSTTPKKSAKKSAKKKSAKKKSPPAGSPANRKLAV